MAQTVWLGAQPSVRGSPVEAYLVARSIDLAGLGRQPKSLRYHPGLWCDGAYRPAMVACILGTRGKDRYRMIGCHRTYLGRDEHGRWSKAPIVAPKRVLGAVKGGVIPIWRGKSGLPLRLAPADDIVVLAEGIEDALTIALVYPKARVLAVISVGNLTAVDLPESLWDIVVCADADAPGSPADKAMRRGCQVLIAQGRRVRVARPPSGPNPMETV